MALTPAQRARRARVNMLMGFATFASAKNRTPTLLFASGEQGVWYDPSDLSTMFQDAAGTTPVTTTGQPVGLIRDKSGRGNHASQSTSASRPVLNQDAGGRYYLLFDGVDDSLATSSINPGSVDKVQVFAGVRKLADNAGSLLCEWSANATTNAGSFNIFAPNGTPASQPYTFRSGGSSSVNADPNANLYPAPHTAVLTGLGDISGDTATLRVNGSQIVQNTGDQGTGNYTSQPLYIGQRGGASLPANMRLYGLLVRFSASSLDSDTRGQMETWLNGKTGAY